MTPYAPTEQIGPDLKCQLGHVGVILFKRFTFVIWCCTNQGNPGNHLRSDAAVDPLDRTCHHFYLHLFQLDSGCFYLQVLDVVILESRQILRNDIEESIVVVLVPINDHWHKNTYHSEYQIINWWKIGGHFKNFFQPHISLILSLGREKGTWSGLKQECISILTSMTTPEVRRERRLWALIWVHPLIT